MKTLSPKLGISVLVTCLALANTLQAAEPDPLKGRAYRGGMQRSGYFDVDGMTSLDGVRWKFPTGGAVKSSPVVVDGTAYFGSNDTHIYAVEVRTAALKWKVKTSGKVTGSAAVLAGVVYIASEGGRLYALDAASGALRVLDSGGVTVPGVDALRELLHARLEVARGEHQRAIDRMASVVADWSPALQTKQRSVLCRAALATSIAEAEHVAEEASAVTMGHPELEAERLGWLGMTPSARCIASKAPSRSPAFHCILPSSS